METDQETLKTSQLKPFPYLSGLDEKNHTMKYRILLKNCFGGSTALKRP